jgi:hypothetical protein
MRAPVRRVARLTTTLDRDGLRDLLEETWRRAGGESVARGQGSPRDA